MKKVALIFAALLVLFPLALSAQVIVSDDFSTLGDWVPGYGEWGIRGGMLVQRDTSTGLARIDRPVPQSNEIEISFKVRYQAGGFEDTMALNRGYLHAGFGIQIGVENPPLGRVAWGDGNSYLLWLNLDTRPDTMANASQHVGFRGQVYRSRTNAVMDLSDDARYGVQLNADIIAALNANGINLGINDLQRYLDVQVPIKLRVNYTTGVVMVMDPTNPSLWLTFDLDPAVLRGNYMSLRTNSLAVSFADFMVTSR
jgi:hypothetical protein